jgi:D-glycero-D-manno-heptose 1,7-bisphosphate phosphatase
LIHNRIIVLDRDGVLNAMVRAPEQGTLDSPLHPSQVQILPGVAKALRGINLAGYEIAVATNQPAAAKGKARKECLEEIQRLVLHRAQAEGGRVLRAEVCWHSADQGCSCRKPRTGMLESIFRAYPALRKEHSWMVGDRITDVMAGQSFGLNTALLRPKNEPVFPLEGIAPTFKGDSLWAFMKFLTGERNSKPFSGNAGGDCSRELSP